MKKSSVRRIGLVVLAVVAMTLLGLPAIRTATPTGVLVAPVAGIISVAVTIALGTAAGVSTAFVAGIFLVFLQNADWLLVGNFVLCAILIGWLVGWRIPLARDLSFQQLIWLGILAGIIEVVLTTLAAAFGGLASGNWLAYARIGFQPAVLTGLLYAVLVGPVTLAFRWLGRQLLPDDDQDDHHDSPHGPVEIDLSSKKKKNQKQ